MLTSQYSLDLNQELIVDNFAGGGGASAGIEMALGRHVDHAINHDRYALGMHRINHPQTIHHCEDVFDIDPATICEGRPVGLAHFSPDCKHFSKAKGGKPLDKKIRGLVLVMLRWAKYKSRVMTMENVEEITTWGPLKKIKKKGVSGWYPDPRHKGRTWLAFLDILSTGIRPDHPDLPEILDVLAGTVTKAECVRGFGYAYEARQIRAADLGSPTIRKRLYMVARCDGKSIEFPDAAYFNPNIKGNANRNPWRTIAECIDWSRPCPSIFLTKAEAKARGINCKRPLANPTLRRLAMGVDRYVLKSAKPFLVKLTHQGGERIESIDEPARTITGANRGETAVVAPALSRFNGDHAGREDGAVRNQSIEQPISVQDTSNRFGLTQAELIGPVVVNTANSKTTGRAPNTWPVDEPARTVTGAPAFALGDATLAPFVTEHANASQQRNMPADEPARTICGEVKGGHLAVVTGTLVQTGYGEREGQEPRALDLEKPLGTIVSGGKHAVVTGTLVHTAHGEQDAKGKRRGRGAHDMQETMPSVLGSSDGAVVVGTLVGAGGRASQSRPRAADEPLHTSTAKADTCLAAASMVKFQGDPPPDSSQGADHPLGSITAGGGKHGVVAATVIRHFGESVGQPADAPAPTTVAGGGGKTGIVAASLTKFNTGSTGQELNDPIATITAGTHSPETHGGAGSTHGVSVAYLAQHNAGNATNPGHPADAPVSTVSTKGCQQQLVAASAVAYFGSERDGQAVDEPSRTVSTKPRLALTESTLVEPMTPEQIYGARQVAAFLRSFGVVFEGEFATVAGYVIVDLGMRMLTPRELFRAQGFGETYIIDRAYLVDPKTGAVVVVNLTKEQQIRMCGNSVCPQVAEALIRANVPELASLANRR